MYHIRGVVAVWQKGFLSKRLFERLLGVKPAGVKVFWRKNLPTGLSGYPASSFCNGVRSGFCEVSVYTRRSDDACMTVTGATQFLGYIFATHRHPFSNLQATQRHQSG